MAEVVLTAQQLDEIKEYILERLPAVLEQDPRFVTFIEGIVAEKFPRRDEFARLLEAVEQHRSETATQFKRVDQRFEGVDQRLEQIDRRFEQVDQRFERLEREFQTHRQETAEGFHQVQVSIDRLGSRWGIRNEAVFRQTMRSLLEGSFGVEVKELVIDGEQFDVAIFNGDHILIEIAASAGRNIQQRLMRKQQRYIDATGETPTRFLFVVGSIHSNRVHALREAGFEVIEPEDDEDGREVLEIP